MPGKKQEQEQDGKQERGEGDFSQFPESSIQQGQSATATQEAPPEKPPRTAVKKGKKKVVKKMAKKGKHKGVTYKPPPEEQEESSLKKRGRKPQSEKEKFVKSVLRKAEIEALPSLDQLFRGKTGTKMKVSDIGVFIGTPQEPLLAELAKEWTLRNRVNLSTEVNLKWLKKVACEILSAGRFFSPISVSKLTDKKDAIECWDGRHRLAFIALFYGLDVTIPVNVDEHTLTEAREAVVYANSTRPTLAMEKAEHMVLKATDGKMDVDRDPLYYRTVTSKSRVPRFAAYSVFQVQGRGMKLDFPVSLSRQKGNALTTVSNVMQFWKNALTWDKEMKRAEFDNQLRESCKFLNDMVAAMQKLDGFKSDQALAGMTMAGVGALYREFYDEDEEAPIQYAELYAQKLVDMGDIGRQKSEDTRKSLSIRVRRDIE